MIAVVDDDVWFAEEIQDLLMLHGHRLVVVVSHPQASSLALLDHASLLILDLSLATTTALNVLEEMRQRGSNPPVVMVSGSGEEALEIARAVAVDRGFSVLGALPKPVVPTDLLGLLAGTDFAAMQTARAHAGTMGTATMPNCDPILTCETFSYAGTYVRSAAPSAWQAALPPNPLVLLAERPQDDPRRIVRAAMAARQLLAMGGQDGFLVVQLPDATLLDPATRSDVCAGFGYSPQLRSQIVFEIDPEVRIDPLAHVAAMIDLRLAGYGLLLRAKNGDLAPLTRFGELPITIFAIDLSAPRIQRGVLQDTIASLRRRTVTSLCVNLQSIDDLREARDLGFSLVGLSPDATPVQA